MTYLAPAVQGALGMLVITAGAFDLRYRRVPNWLVLMGLAAGLGLNSALYGTAGLWLGLEGAGVAMLIYIPLYLLRAMGAGDAKLMMAVGSLAGPANWLVLFMITAVLGSVVGLAVLASQSKLRHGLRNLWLILSSLAHKVAPYKVSPELDVRSGQGSRLPHAAVITFGTLIFLWATAVLAPR